MATVLLLITLYLTIVSSVDIIVSDSNGRTTIEDDDLLEKALKKALTPLGAKSVDVDHYESVPGAFKVSITIDADKIPENKDNLEKALTELGFKGIRIEEATFGGVNLHILGIRDRYIVYLDPKTMEKTMELFAASVIDTSSDSSEWRRLKLALKEALY